MKHHNHALVMTMLARCMFRFTLCSVLPVSAQSGAMSPSPVRATRNFRFEHLTPEEGLPSLTVRSIVQDQQGFLWFATSNGLARYDGYTVKTFHNDPLDPHSISTETFGTLYVDRQGILWAGTWNGGLNVFDQTTEQFTRYVHDPDDPSSLSHNRVNVIFEDNRGRLWLGTDGGVDRFDRTTGQFTRYQYNPQDPQSLSNNTVKTIIEDTSGQLWVGTLGGGLNMFDPASGQFTRYQHDPQNPNSLMYDNIEAIAIEADGRLWIGTMAGLDHFDPTTGRFTHYRHDPADPQSLSSEDITALYIDASGEMWVGTTKGLNLFDPHTTTFTRVLSNPTTPDGFHGEWLSSIYADSSGALWFATTSHGINRLDRAAARFELYQHDPDDPDSLSPRGIWSILRDHSGTLWVATVGGGLNKQDPVTGGFQHYRHNPADPQSLSSDSLFAMAEDATGALWIGTKEGLNRFDRTTEQFTRYTHDPANPASLSENWVAGLYVDRSGRVWVGTIGKGLNLYDPATDSFRRYQSDPENPHSLSDNNPLTFAEDPLGQLWIGTISGGLNRFDPETSRFTRYLHDSDNLNSVISNDVQQIYLDQAGVLWLATSAGLDRFDPHTETFTHYAEQQGLASKALASVVGDAHGNIWVGMQGSGLARFDPRRETFRNYDQSDGLQSDNFMPRAAYRDVDGKLYFGGMNGLNAFYPDHLRDNPYIPPVVLIDFQIFNQAVPIGGQDSPLQRVINETNAMTLSHRQSVFSFEFAALNYRSPKKNRYAYQLEGFDTEWNYVSSSRRFATYTNLDAGTYTFRVKASNNDGVWNEVGKTITITITPPWWQTWWCYTLGVIGVLGIFGFIYQSKANQLRAERAAALAVRESERTYREIFNAMSDALFIHDETARVIDVNDRMCAMFGYNREAVLGRSLQDFSLGTPPYSLSEAEAWVHRALQAGPQVFEWHCKRRKGQLFWSEIALHACTIAGKQRVIASVRDITERKQAEEALKESEEKFRSLAEQSPNMIFINKRGKVVYANKRCEEIMGYTREEFYAADFDFVALTAPEYVDLVKTRFAQHMRGEEVEPYEYALVTKDGGRIEAILAPRLIHYGGESAILGVITDISERKRGEEHIRTLNAELEDRVKQRTAQLEATNKELQHFAYVVSHDLKAPLRNITQLVNWLVEDYAAAFDAQGKQYADLLLNRVKRMENLIMGVLEYSRVSHAEMQNAPLDLAALLYEVIDTLAPPPHITITLPDTLPTIVADKTRIFQVFQNLIGNAIKYNDKPHGIIAVSSVDDGSCWRFRVTDNGPGIDPKHHDKLFQIFQTLHPRDEVESTGVGLAIVKKIAEFYGGNVGVESEVGKGSTFWFTIPKESQPPLSLE